MQVDVDLESEEENQDEDFNVEDRGSSEVNGNLEDSFLINVPKLYVANSDNNTVSNNEKNRFLIVRYSTPKRILHYVGCIENCENDKIYVNFFRKSKTSGNNLSFIFTKPNVKDVAMVEESDIVAWLPEPEKLTRGRIAFDFNFDCFENII